MKINVDLPLWLACFMSFIVAGGEDSGHFIPDDDVKCCEPGWTGDGCEIECPNCNTRIHDKQCQESCRNGKFGTLCESECSTSCKKDSNGFHTCDKRSGDCLSGCELGYHGHRCENDCSMSCLDHNCNYKTGSCVDCPRGRYGPECIDKCGQCAGDTDCERDGSCGGGCQDGWCGRRCDVHCPVEQKGSSAAPRWIEALSCLMIVVILGFWMIQKFLKRKYFPVGQEDENERLSNPDNGAERNMEDAGDICLGAMKQASKNDSSKRKSNTSASHPQTEDNIQLYLN